MMDTYNLEEQMVKNIVRVEVVEEGGNTYVLQTADEAGVTPRVEKGKEEIQYSDDGKMCGVGVTMDVVIGYTIRLLDVRIPPEGLEALKRGQVAVHVYTREPDCDGTTVSYFQFTFPRVSIADMPVDRTHFPEMRMVSRVKKGEKPVHVCVLDKLPQGA